VVATWPAVGSFRSSFVADGAPAYGEAAAGDHLQTVYRFWLVGHQLERGDAPWTDPYSFQPLVEPQVVVGGWPFGIPFWPLDAAFGPVAAWNLLLLAGIVAAGLLAYAWLRALGLGAAAAAVGGLAFAVAPYRVLQSGGHLLGWVAILLPLCLLGVERARSAGTGRAGHAWGALGSLALVSIPLSGQVHLALGAIPLVLAYAGARFRPLAFWWTVAGAAVAVGVGLVIRYTLIAGSIEAGGRSLGEVRQFQAGFRDLVDRFPPPGTDVFASERFVYLGWLTPLLAAAGAAVLARAGRRWLAAVLGLGVLIPVVLALGTHVPIYEPLWNALPPFRFPRVPERLLPVACLCLAGLAAFAVARLLDRTGGRRAPLVAGAVLALVAADLVVQPLHPSAADPGNAAYAAVRASPGRILELPLFEPGIHFGSVYEYYELQAPREHPSGYSTLAPSPAFDFYFLLNRVNCGVWLPGDEERIAALGVRSLLFHAGLYAQAGRPGSWFAWHELQQHGWRAAANGGQVTLLRRGAGAPSPAPAPEPSRRRVVFCEGWSGRTMVERQGPLWIYGEGRLDLTVTAPGTTGAQVWADGRVDQIAVVRRRAAISLSLHGVGWHWVMLDVPRLFLDVTPAQGLTVERLALLPGGG
jgi:hypothetical protein